MRGVANYMAGRLKLADDDLARGVLRGDPSAALWRAVIAVERGEWERAVEFFRASDKQINLYSVESRRTVRCRMGGSRLADQ
jgi:hypothetical protein